MDLLFPAAHHQRHHHHKPSGGATAAASETNHETLAQIAELASVLDRAAQSAKLLSSTWPSSTHTQAALASLRAAHELMGSVLGRIDVKQSADVDELMPEAEGEGESRIIEEVEEGIKECVLQSKRLKRPASPSWPAADRSEDAPPSDVAAAADRRRAAVDLVMQFHA